MGQRHCDLRTSEEKDSDSRGRAAMKSLLTFTNFFVLHVLVSTGNPFDFEFMTGSGISREF